jgi:hypothetical protein
MRRSGIPNLTVTIPRAVPRPVIPASPCSLLNDRPDVIMRRPGATMLWPISSTPPDIVWKPLQCCLGCYYPPFRHLRSASSQAARGCISGTQASPVFASDDTASDVRSRPIEPGDWQAHVRIAVATTTGRSGKPSSPRCHTVPRSQYSRMAPGRAWLALLSLCAQKLRKSPPSVMTMAFGPSASWSAASTRFGCILPWLSASALVIDCRSLRARSSCPPQQFCGPNRGPAMRDDYPPL